MRMRWTRRKRLHGGARARDARAEQEAKGEERRGAVGKETGRARRKPGSSRGGAKKPARERNGAGAKGERRASGEASAAALAAMEKGYFDAAAAIASTQQDCTELEELARWTVERDRRRHVRRSSQSKVSESAVETVEWRA